MFLYLLLIPIIGVGAISNTDVRSMANLVNSRLLAFSNSMQLFADIRRLYDKQEHEFVRIDGFQLVANISTKLGKVFVEAENVAHELSQSIAKNKSLQAPLMPRTAKSRLYQPWYHVKAADGIWYLNPTSRQVTPDAIQYSLLGSAANVSAANENAVVIILDTSASMDPMTFGVAKQIVLHLLDKHVLASHYVAVLTSTSQTWDTGGADSSGDVSVLGFEGLADAVLRQASTEYKHMVNTSLNSLKAAGGSDHRQAFSVAFHMLKEYEAKDENNLAIYFISDWNITDGKKVCCTRGYKTFVNMDAKKSFVAGSRCKFDYDPLVDLVAMLQYSMSVGGQVQINVAVVAPAIELTEDREATDLRQAGRLACDNNGYLCKVALGQPIDAQLQMWDKFLNPQTFVITKSASTVVRSPLDDQPVFLSSRLLYSGGPSQPRELGVDVPLKIIEFLLMNASLNNKRHVFLTDTQGVAIVHPLVQQSHFGEIRFASLFDLEIDSEGQPQRFHDVMSRIVSVEQSGDYRIAVNARRAMIRRGVATWVPVASSHYFYSRVPGTQLIVGLVIYNDEFLEKHVVLSDSDTPNMASDAKDTHLNQVDPPITFLSPQCFTNPGDFFDQVDAMCSIDDGLPRNWSQLTGLHDSARRDLMLMPFVDSFVYRMFNSSSLLMYLASSSGVTRVYRNVDISCEELLAKDITLEAWYESAVVHANRLTVSGVEYDSKLKQNIVTLSQAISLSSPNDVISGSADVTCVSAASVNAELFTDAVMTELTPGESACNCQQTHCETRCHVMNDLGEFVTSPGGTLFGEYPGLFRRLVRHDLFYVRRWNDTLATCSTDNGRVDDDFVHCNGTNCEEPVEELSLRRFMSASDLKKTKTRYTACSLQRTIYIVNTTLLYTKYGDQFNLTSGGCFSGEFFLSPITSTNLFLVVVRQVASDQPLCSDDEDRFVTFYSTKPVRLRLASANRLTSSHSADKLSAFNLKPSRDEFCGHSASQPTTSLSLTSLIISLLCSQAMQSVFSVSTL